MRVLLKKVLLKVDALTNKVYAYKESLNLSEKADLAGKDRHIRETMQYDVMLELTGFGIFAEAEKVGKDIFFENGQLITRLKDPDEFHNATSRLLKEIKRLETNEQAAFNAFAASGRPTDEAYWKAITAGKKQKEQALLKFKEAYIKQLRQKKIEEIIQTNYKHYCSVCLLIRDENEYLKEWLVWHIGQGVQHFYIYDNGSVQPVVEFIKTLDIKIQNKITVIDFGGIHAHLQHEAYNDCLKRFGDESRWIGFIDSDEMVRVKDGKKLSEFLREYEDYAGLFMPWILYDANGHKDKSDLPCRERFTKVSEKNLWPGMGKVFVQPCYMRNMMIHNGYPIDGFTVVDESKNPVEDAPTCVPEAKNERICVDHYYTKSLEEWTEKMKRGSCNPDYGRKYDEFFYFNPELSKFYKHEISTQKYEISKKFDEEESIGKSEEKAIIEAPIKSAKSIASRP